jgi:hypothetical protein
MTSRSSFTKVLGCALLAAAVGGCTHRDAFPRPKSVQSFCHSGTVNVEALRRVVAGAMDGEHYKSGAAPFEAKVLPQVTQFGGAVAYWDSEELARLLPITSAALRRSHVEPIGVAVPDNGDPNYDHRLVYLALYGYRHSLTAWQTEGSRDLERVCT